jgi:transposase
LGSWFIPQNFIFPQRDQPLLLPVDMREWLPEDDLVFIVLDAVATVDLAWFRRRYRADGRGRAAFDPEMMVALLLYGYCQGERSSRVIEKRCVRDVGYRLIAGGLRPDHATIARFRARHEAALGGLFSQVVRLLAAEGMVSLGLVSLDGTKLAGTEPRANITDPDVRVMRNQKGYVAGYNGQLVVTADQVIVGAMLTGSATEAYPVCSTSSGGPGFGVPTAPAVRRPGRWLGCHLRVTTAAAMTFSLMDSAPEIARWASRDTRPPVRRPQRARLGAYRDAARAGRLPACWRLAVQLARAGIGGPGPQHRLCHG